MVCETVHEYVRNIKICGRDVSKRRGETGTCNNFLFLFPKKMKNNVHMKKQT